jgi:hypothetical protein
MGPQHSRQRRWSANHSLEEVLRDLTFGGCGHAFVRLGSVTRQTAEIVSGFVECVCGISQTLPVSWEVPFDMLLDGRDDP